ncbi:MAG: MBL fold metallo-hydrolase [Oscillospiraceae bacterium]|jgi:glyoxylase-like metal-dependent hydrolase (beta-lactamase superfamily II)|nr:MBL fold metallo-hydrolase [Oscillospiraceae bacterium]
MLIKCLPVGHLETNCYVVADEITLECAIIDPGAEATTILNYIEERRLAPRAIFITHAHFDHIMALPALDEELRVPVYVHPKELAGETSRSEAKLSAAFDLREYKDGDTVDVGGLSFGVIETPGHTPGGVTLLCGDALFTGDTLFKDSCGRTDLGGDMDVLLASLRKLAALPGDFEVYPGHAEATTLENERRFNYYVRYALGSFPAQ